MIGTLFRVTDSSFIVDPRLYRDRAGGQGRPPYVNIQKYRFTRRPDHK